MRLTIMLEHAVPPRKLVGIGEPIGSEGGLGCSFAKHDATLSINCDKKMSCV